MSRRTAPPVPTASSATMPATCAPARSSGWAARRARPARSRSASARGCPRRARRWVSTATARTSSPRSAAAGGAAVSPSTVRAASASTARASMVTTSRTCGRTRSGWSTAWDRSPRPRSSLAIRMAMAGRYAATRI